MVLGAPAVPVAVNVTGEPFAAALAVNAFEPAVFPSVQLPTVATPWLFVVVDAPVTDPPPAATANVTVSPTTGLFRLSFTLTLGATFDPAVATFVPTVAD
jgi:hypothetical protein